MNRKNFLIALGLAAAGIYAMRAISASYDETTAPWLAPPDPTQNTGDFAAVQNANATADQRVAAGLALIRKFESNGDYSVLYGGGHFEDFSRHPNVRVPFTDPRTGSENFSTAAGAYQINFPTWTSEIQPALGLPDFSPESQDQAAVYLLQQSGAYDALAAGDVDKFLRLASKRWASLPYSTAEQHPRTIELAMNTFSDFLNSIGA